MEKKSGGEVKEELLFHGTVKEVLSAICQQNFDHRLSGTRVGAKHGQGIYCWVIMTLHYTKENIP